MGKFTDICFSFLWKDFYRLHIQKISKVCKNALQSYSNRYNPKAVILTLF